MEKMPNNLEKSPERAEQEKQTYIKEVKEIIKEAEISGDESEKARYELVLAVLNSFSAVEIDNALERIENIREIQDLQ